MQSPSPVPPDTIPVRIALAGRVLEAVRGGIVQDTRHPLVEVEEDEVRILVVDEPRFRGVGQLLVEDGDGVGVVGGVGAGGVESEGGAVDGRDAGGRLGQRDGGQVGCDMGG